MQRMLSSNELMSLTERLYSTQYHPASTASMLPLEKGGVVDTRLKVYHTEGLRVIDSSGEYQSDSLQAIYLTLFSHPNRTLRASYGAHVCNS